MPQQSHMLARIRTRGGERGLDGLKLGGGGGGDPTVIRFIQIPTIILRT